MDGHTCLWHIFVLHLFFLVGLVVTFDGRCRSSLLNGRGGQIPNAAFSASSYLISDRLHGDFSPPQVRMDTALDTEMRSPWKAGTLNKDQFAEVDLGAPSLVRTVETVGCDSINDVNYCNEYVTKYRLQYSLDGNTWFTVKTSNGEDKIFQGNADSHGLVTNDVGCYTVARYVRVNPIQWHSYITMKFDLFGCKLPKGNANSRPNFGVIAKPIGGDNAVNVPTLGAGGHLHQSYTGTRTGTVYNLAEPRQSNSLTISANKKPASGKVCIGGLNNMSCWGMPNGSYQHCVSCKKFIKCSNYTLSEFVCPDDLLWDDNVDDCMLKSTTCK